MTNFSKKPSKASVKSFNLNCILKFSKGEIVDKAFQVWYLFNSPNSSLVLWLAFLSHFFLGRCDGSSLWIVGGIFHVVFAHHRISWACRSACHPGWTLSKFLNTSNFVSLVLAPSQPSFKKRFQTSQGRIYLGDTRRLNTMLLYST